MSYANKNMMCVGLLLLMVILILIFILNIIMELKAWIVW